MHLTTILEGTVRLELSERELVIVNNAINEICHCVEIIGFESRIGASRAEAAALLGQVGAVIDETKGKPGFGS